ncbi:hypothetical protein DP49_5824 [Burkholderia pseudomallei]|nr:hypothetical protein DP49_5824 [Burkholderia pseudomallei]
MSRTRHLVNQWEKRNCKRRYVRTGSLRAAVLCLVH